MDIHELLKHVDHTLLSPSATFEDIRTVCDEGMEYKTASVCIPPCYVRQAKDYVRDRLKICTVVGFPCGYCKTEVKCFETERLINDGADEIDAVINIGMLKAGDFNAVLKELCDIRAACTGHIFKVIIETHLLTRDEKIHMCDIVSRSGADYIKTSTGFSGGGATRDDVRLLCENAPSGLKVKASGGISSITDAYEYLELGADRLGTSKIVKLIKEM